MTRMHTPCDTPHCPNDHARRRLRCTRCMNHKQCHGVYPDLTPQPTRPIPPPTPHAGYAGEPDWLFNDALTRAVYDMRLLGLTVGE